MLTQAHRPPFHASYTPVLTDRGFRTNKKRQVQDMATEGGKAAPKGKRPGEFPTPAEAAQRGKDGRTWWKKRQTTSEFNQHQ